MLTKIHCAMQNRLSMSTPMIKKIADIVSMMDSMKSFVNNFWSEKKSTVSRLNNAALVTIEVSKSSMPIRKHATPRGKQQQQVRL